MNEELFHVAQDQDPNDPSKWAPNIASTGGQYNEWELIEWIEKASTYIHTLETKSIRTWVIQIPSHQAKLIEDTMVPEGTTILDYLQENMDEWPNFVDGLTFDFKPKVKEI